MQKQRGTRDSASTEPPRPPAGARRVGDSTAAGPTRGGRGAPIPSRARAVAAAVQSSRSGRDPRIRLPDSFGSRAAPHVLAAGLPLSQPPAAANAGALCCMPLDGANPLDLQ